MTGYYEPSASRWDGGSDGDDSRLHCRCCFILTADFVPTTVQPTGETMTLHSAILVILAQLQPSPRDTLPESYVARVHRLDTISSAIASVSDRVSCHEQPQPCHRMLDRVFAAAVLVEQARRESEYRLDVQLGQCRPHECDRGRARGLWQTHWAPQSEPRATWLGYAGESQDAADSTARRAIALWAGGYYAHRRSVDSLDWPLDELTAIGRRD